MWAWGDPVDYALEIAFREVAKIRGPTEEDWDIIRSILQSNHNNLKVDGVVFDTIASDIPTDVWHLLVLSENTYVRPNLSKVLRPLHYAVTAGISDEKVIAMIDAYPQAAAFDDSEGKAPLSYAIECLMRYNQIISPKIIHRLLAAHPSAVTFVDEYGNIPLQDIFLKFAPSDCKLYGNQEIYEIITLLLQAVTCGTVENLLSPFPTLHAAISTQCPWSLVQLILSVDPIQAQLYNKEGDLPIHIVAAIKPSHDGELLECFRCECERREREANNASHCPPNLTHHFSCRKCDYFRYKNECKLIDPFYKKPAVIKELIAANSKAASIPNHDDRLLLNIAIQNGRLFGCEGVRNIFQAAPLALSTRDIGTHMYSFMLAAVEYNEQTRRNEGVPSNEFLGKLTSCFELLVENPVLVSSGIPAKGNKRKHNDNIDI